MKAKKKISKAPIVGILIALIIIPILVILVIRMEGEPPVMQLELDSPALGPGQTLTLQVSDDKSGIRQVWAAVLKDGKESVLVDRTFPAGGFLSGGAVREETLQIAFDPEAEGIKDGKAVLRLVTRDYSWRKWGKGNQSYQEQEIVIDTHAPDIEVLSRVHNLNQGGAGLVVYKVSEDCRSSGVMVGDEFYPGSSGGFGDPDIFMTFIALNHKQGAGTRMFVTATDFAGNQGRGGFAYHINGRRFKKDVIPVSDRFLNWKMPEFKSQVGADGNSSLLDVFLKVNRDMRRANYETLTRVTKNGEKQIFWRGDFLRLPHAANRAGFADFRTYTYKGKKIDEQTHLGIDLASVEQSPVPAANSGKVVFADTLGIYGRTIVLDHGFGLFSMYSHLSHMDVSPGDAVSKGDIIGKTGRSGLAGGDHLHFSMLVHHTFVNPLEWWDTSWIQNNVLTKLAELK